MKVGGTRPHTQCWPGYGKMKRGESVGGTRPRANETPTDQMTASTRGKNVGLKRWCKAIPSSRPCHHTPYPSDSILKFCCCSGEACTSHFISAQGKIMIRPSFKATVRRLFVKKALTMRMSGKESILLPMGNAAAGCLSSHHCPE